MTSVALRHVQDAYRLKLELKLLFCLAMCLVAVSVSIHDDKVLALCGSIMAQCIVFLMLDLPVVWSFEYQKEIDASSELDVPRLEEVRVRYSSRVIFDLYFSVYRLAYFSRFVFLILYSTMSIGDQELKKYSISLALQAAR